MLFGWKKKTVSFDTDGKVRRHIFFSGRVQGVGFRFTAQGLARSLGLTGSVRNLWDGRVEMEVQGPPQAIERMLSELQQDRYIRIEAMEVSELSVREETRFTMHY